MASDFQGSRSPQPGDGRGAGVGALMKQVERYIHEQNYEAALAIIRAIRSQDEDNPYANAYEERIQLLLSMKRAVKTAQAGAAAVAAGGADPSPISRQEALQKNLEAILTRARELFAQKEFELSLEEFHRARLLAPGNPEISALESQVRAARDEAEKSRAQSLKGQQEEAEKLRVDMLRRELVRLQQEKDARRLQQDEAKRKAQEGKLQEGIAAARETLSAGAFDEAREQLRFLRLLDPAHPALDDLELEIGAAESAERRKREEEDQRRLAEEEKKRHALAEAVQRFIDTANRFTDLGDFPEALRTITRAYLLDPVNADLRACEQSILVQREEAARREREVQRAKEEAERKRHEEEMQTLALAEQERLREEERRAVEVEERERRTELARLLERVQKALEKDDLRGALEGIAHAFKLDPFDSDVQRIEQEIRQRQARKRIVVQKPANEVPDAGAQARKILEQAETLLRGNDLEGAFDEVTRALSVDPLNVGAKKLETDITARLMARQKVEPAPHHSVGISEPVKLDDTISAFRQTLSSLSASAPEKAPPVAPPSAGVSQPNALLSAQSPAQNGIAARTEELLQQGAFDEALAEVAIALLESPDDPGLRALEQRIWEERERQQGKGALRLVHPRSSAGNGN
jgi:hypothetical protein